VSGVPELLDARGSRFRLVTTIGTQDLLFRTSARDELTPPLHRTPPGQHTGRLLAEGAPLERTFVPRVSCAPGFGAIVTTFRCIKSGSLVFVFSSLT